MIFNACEMSGNLRNSGASNFSRAMPICRWPDGLPGAFGTHGSENWMTALLAVWKKPGVPICSVPGRAIPKRTRPKFAALCQSKTCQAKTCRAMPVQNVPSPNVPGHASPKCGKQERAMPCHKLACHARHPVPVPPCFHICTKLQKQSISSNRITFLLCFL